MSWFVLPDKRSPAVPEEVRTDVFMALRRLLALWRTDPDKLAAAMSAWCLAGYPGGNAIEEVADGSFDLGIAAISRDEARQLIVKALHNRHSRRLRALGEGLLMGLEVLAADAEFARLHRVREDSAVIECRVLPIDERIAKLREKEAASA